MPEDPPNLDPQRGVDELSWWLLALCHEGLVGDSGPSGRAAGLAERWTVSPDGCTYTFYLRPGLRWSDGEPLTAAHCAYSFRRALDPRNGLRAAWPMYAIRGARTAHRTPPGEAGRIAAALDAVGVAVDAGGVLRITLESPTPYFPRLLSLPPLMPVRPDRTPPQSPSELPGAVFSGPFIIRAYRPGSHLDLEPNPHYWNAACVRLSGIQVLIGGAAGDRYRRGEVDLIPVDHSDVPHLDPSHLYWTPEATTLYLVCNTRDPLLDNVHVRRAIALALDRTRVAAEGIPGSTAATGLVPPAIWNGQFRTTAGDLLSPAADPGAARAEWERAEAELGLDSRPHLTLLAGDSAGNVAEAQAVAACLHEHLGLRVEVQTAGYSDRYWRVRRGEFQLALLAWKADYDDPIAFLGEHVSDGLAGNQSKWSNPAYNQLISRARGTMDARERQQLLIEAERMLVDAAPVTPLAFRRRCWAVRPGVEGVVHLPVGPSPELRWAAVLPGA